MKKYVAEKLTELLWERALERIDALDLAEKLTELLRERAIERMKQNAIELIEPQADKEVPK